MQHCFAPLLPICSPWTLSLALQIFLHQRGIDRVSCRSTLRRSNNRQLDATGGHEQVCPTLCHDNRYIAERMKPRRTSCVPVSHSCSTSVDLYATLNPLPTGSTTRSKSGNASSARK